MLKGNQHRRLDQQHTINRTKTALTLVPGFFLIRKYMLKLPQNAAHKNQIAPIPGISNGAV
jgi:hypothetical protein